VSKERQREALSCDKNPDHLIPEPFQSSSAAVNQLLLIVVNCGKMCDKLWAIPRLIKGTPYATGSKDLKEGVRFRWFEAWFTLDRWEDVTHAHV
jgi:hypothetical protein